MTSDTILNYKMATSGKQPNTTTYGYFRNRNNVQMPSIDPGHHFEFEDDRFPFLENNENN